MKQAHPHTRLGKICPPPPIYILLTILLCSSMLRAQTPATYRYEHDPSLSFIYSGSDVMIKYVGTTTYNEGVLKFQPVQENTSFSNQLQVSLVDGVNGAVQYSEVYGLGVGEDLVPIACAYNPTLANYLVTGVCQSAAGTGLNNFSTWYMLFDDNLTLLYSGLIELQSANTQGGIIFNSNQSTVVTDVSHVTDMGTQRHFVFTGMLLESGNNADPYFIAAQPTNRRIFVAVLDAVTNQIIDANEYYMFNVPPTTDITQYTFPSRIIEIRASNPSAATRGYLIGGTTVNQGLDNAKRAFYMRLFGDLQLMDHKLLDVNLPDHVLAVGDMYQEEFNGDVMVAGTITHMENALTTQYYFFDKLNDITNGINVASKVDAWPTNGGAASIQFGVYKIPTSLPKLRGFPKVGRISNVFFASNLVGNAITASVCRNDFYQNNTYYSALLPFTMLVRYDDASLDFWPTTQNTTCELYPRWDGMLGPVAFYQGMSFDSPWYPNHISFEYSHRSRLFSLGQLGIDQLASGDVDVINIVERPSNGMNCYEDAESVDAEYMAVLLDNLTIYTNGITRNIAGLSPQITSPAIIMDECSSVNLFKEASSTMTDNVNINHSEKKVIAYELYDLSGARVFRQANIDYRKNIEFSFSHLANGIYIQKIMLENGICSYKKIIVQ